MISTTKKGGQKPITRRKHLPVRSQQAAVVVERFLARVSSNPSLFPLGLALGLPQFSLLHPLDPLDMSGVGGGLGHLLRLFRSTLL
jgi:hypothetical protein